MPVVITDIPRPPEALVQAFQELDVATVHEAQGRKGLLASYMRPIYRPAKIIGTAITCEVAPGDNDDSRCWSKKQVGDILVVAPTSPCETDILVI